MKYKNNGLKIELGDHVLVEGDVCGVVVCDFDSWRCVDGYEDWLSKEELVGGGKLSSGILVETKKLGFLQYAREDETIVKNAI
jgi:hypothetical protein